MKKIILVFFIVNIVFFSGCYKIEKENAISTDVNSKDKYMTTDIDENKKQVYDLLDLEAFDKAKKEKKDIAYVVILDTGIDQIYAQSFYQSECSCISKILSYSSDSIYATESRHGTLMQQFFDEMSVRAGTIDTIKTIHFKIKESDEEEVSIKRIMRMLKQVLKLKQEGYNIVALNISQVFECDNEETDEIVDMVHTLFENGVITVTASGNKYNFQVEKNIFAKSDESIVVGGINMDNQQWINDEQEGSPVSNSIDIYSYASDIMLGEKVPYYSEKVSGTSYSTIIISWQIANYISMHKGIETNQARSDIINAVSIKNELQIFDVKKLYKKPTNKKSREK